MDTIMMVAFAALFLLMIGFIGYTTVTDSIIKDQQREINKLKAALRGKPYVKNLRLYQERQEGKAECKS